VSATELRGVVIADGDAARGSSACPPRRSGWADLAATVLLTGGFYAAFPRGLPNYDGFYALVWGSDLLAGRIPQYDAPVASAPHPLAIVIAALAALFGDGAQDAYRLVAVLAAAALCVGLFRLGQELVGWPVGLLAAGLLATRAPFLESVTRASFDMVAVALIVWAAVLEARRARRGTAVLVLLMLAGLLRPEAWLYAGVYWLWLGFGRTPPPRPAGLPISWRRFVRLPARPEVPRLLGLLVLVLVAPVVWAASDFLVTGDPAWTRHQTERVAELRSLPTGVLGLPGVLVRHLGGILWVSVLAAAVVGFGLGVLRLARRLAVAIALAALSALSVLALAVNGLPVLQRFLFLPAALACLFAAVAALGWRALPRRDRLRAPWRSAGVVVIAVMLAFVPADLARIAQMRDRTLSEDRVHTELRELVRRPVPRAALGRCRTVYVPTGQPIPSLALWTDLRPRRFSADLGRSRLGALLAPRSSAAEALLLGRPGELAIEAPAGHRPIGHTGSWALTSGCGGA
jgi:hypothetical protein